MLPRPNAKASAGERAYILLELIHSHAPDRVARLRTATLYGQLYHDGNTEEEVEKRLAEVLYDGLKKGNWPWT